MVQQRPGGGDFPIKGLYAAGEAASASVHGANRLGANSLLDLVVFGRACAMDIASGSQPGEAQPELGERAGEASVACMEQLLASNGHTPTAALRLESQKVGAGQYVGIRECCTCSPDPLAARSCRCLQVCSGMVNC